MDREGAPEFESKKSEYHFPTERELKNKVEAIYLRLLPYLGEAESRKISDFILDSAVKITDETKKIAEDPRVKDVYYYNGASFKNLSKESATFARDGMALLGYIENSLSEVSIGFTPPDPRPEIYRPIIEKHLVVCADTEHNISGLRNRLEAHGNLEMFFDDLEFKDVLNDLPPDEKKELLDQKKAEQFERQSSKAAQSDLFFQNLEKQMNEEDSEK